ncbi:MAG: hypothetical protein ACRDYZ_12020 [Acidimicrobiales bacterium]
MSPIEDKPAKLAKLRELEQCISDKLAKLAGLRELQQRTSADIATTEADVRDQLKQYESKMRGRAKRRPRSHTPECGTESAYQRHRYYGEHRDDACRLAHAEHERSRRRRSVS